MPDASEKKMLREIGLDCSWEPTHIKRIDVNGDGVLDYVISVRRGSTVVIKKEGKLQQWAYVDFSMNAGNFCPTRDGSICIPEISRVPSILQSGYDVMVRTWQGCALFRGTDSQWRFDGYHWNAERFDCSKYDNRAYLFAQIECVASLGKWNAGNWGNWGSCYHPAKDVGKPCKSSSECEKMCIYEGPAVADNENVTGICSQYRECRTEVQNGRLGPHICVD